MIFRVRGNVLIESFHKRIVVFDTHKNLPYIMNEVASFVFLNTDGKKTIEDVAERLCDEYDVNFDQALGDVRNIYEDFSFKQLVSDVK